MISFFKIQCFLLELKWKASVFIWQIFYSKILKCLGFESPELFFPAFLFVLYRTYGGGGRGIDCSMWSFHFGEDLYPVFQSLCPKYACGSTICNRTIWIKMRERFLKVYLKSRILVPILLDNSRVIWHLGLPFAHLHPQSLAIKKLRNMRKPVENSFNSYTVEINPCHYILYYRD